MRCEGCGAQEIALILRGEESALEFHIDEWRVLCRACHDGAHTSAADRELCAISGVAALTEAEEMVTRTSVTS